MQERDKNIDLPAPVEIEAEEAELESAPPPEVVPDITPEDVVEEAEQLLRESAPHDFDVLVLGGGPGGYVAAIRAAQLGARVGLVEAREIGGVCLNRGCIPTKTLLESVDVLRLLRRAGDYGIRVEGNFAPDLAAMHRRKNEVVAGLRENVAHLLEANGVRVLQGRARFVEEHSVEVNGPSGARIYSAVHVIVATGSLPARLPVPGADLPGVTTSDELLEQDAMPQHLVSIGGGAVGVEIAYLARALGARSTLLEMSAQILPQEDAEIAAEMARILTDFGVGLVTKAKLLRIEKSGGELKIVYSQGDEEKIIVADQILMAAGRRANTDDLGLAEAGIHHDKGRIIVDKNCETSVAGVYAVGDCIRKIGWAHLASAEGKMVAERICNHPNTIDLEHVPSCYYTHPEIASCGKTLMQAGDEGIAARAGKFHFRANGRAAAAGDHDGFVKVVIEAETNKLLGCQIIGPRATDLIGEAVLALKTGQTVEAMVGAIHAHPTFSEALPEAALDALGRSDLAD